MGLMSMLVTWLVTFLVYAAIGAVLTFGVSVLLFGSVDPSQARLLVMISALIGAGITIVDFSANKDWMG